MTDIGIRAGVSQATVSLVLNGVPNVRVSAETRRRVVEAAEALGYRKGPRHAAHDTTSRVIGLLIDELSSTPFAVPFLEAARDEAALSDVAVAVFCTKGDPLLENAAVDILQKANLVGILYTTLITRPARLPERFGSVPTIMLNCYGRKGEHVTVLPGDVAGGQAATEALLRAGHRRVVHLAGEDWIEASRDREKGFRQALTNWDIAVTPDMVQRGAWTVDGGRRLTLDLLDRPSRPTGLFCFNDRMAVGAYDAARIRGLRIPQDISIVGFDDEETSSYLSPPLTTLKLPHEEMARFAVERLLDGGAADRGRKVKIECPLVERFSIAPPRPL